MATLPTEQELPPLLSPAKPWFNADGTPTIEYVRYQARLRRFLSDLRDFIEQEHP